jgi:hypothetical protein
VQKLTPQKLGVFSLFPISIHMCACTTIAHRLHFHRLQVKELEKLQKLSALPSEREAPLLQTQHFQVM